MSSIQKFEQLIAWQKARKLAVRIHTVVHSGTFARDFAFSDQMWRAAVSVPSNIAEGFERFAPGEFAHFLSIAKASCAEVRSGLYIAADIGHIDEKTLKELLDESARCGEIIGRLRRYIQSCAARKVQRRTQNTERRTPRGDP